MNIEERTDRSPVIKNFRHTLQIAMGALYIVLGGVIIYTRRLGGFNIELPVYGYLLIGLAFALYGFFRVWRAWQEIKTGKMERLRRDAMDIARQ